MRRSVIITLIVLVTLSLCLCLVHALPEITPPVPPATRSTELGMVLLDEKEQVFVLAIIDNSPAFHAGILAGDTITQLNSQRLASVLQLEEMISRRTGPMDFLLERDGAPVQILLPLQ